MCSVYRGVIKKKKKKSKKGSYYFKLNEWVLYLCYIYDWGRKSKLLIGLRTERKVMGVMRKRKENKNKWMCFISVIGKEEIAYWVKGL